MTTRGRVMYVPGSIVKILEESLKNNNGDVYGIKSNAFERLIHPGKENQKIKPKKVKHDINPGEFF